MILQREDDRPIAIRGVPERLGVKPPESVQIETPSSPYADFTFHESDSHLKKKASEKKQAYSPPPALRSGASFQTDLIRFMASFSRGMAVA
jgi:hypothetical protein